MSTAAERERDANHRKVLAYSAAREAMAQALRAGNTEQDLLAALHAVLAEAGLR